MVVSEKFDVLSREAAILQIWDRALGTVFSQFQKKKKKKKNPKQLLQPQVTVTALLGRKNHLLVK